MTTPTPDLSVGFAINAFRPSRVFRANQDSSGSSARISSNFETSLKFLIRFLTSFLSLTKPIDSPNATPLITS